VKLNINSEDYEVKFVSPKFNSVLKYKLKNKVKLDSRAKYDDIIFIYLNFDMKYQQYESLLIELKM
jgi:hypothetical protein